MDQKDHKGGEDHFEKLKAKLFNKKEFNTLIVGGESDPQKQLDLEEVILILAEPRLNFEEKDEALKVIKESNAKAAILRAIKKTKNEDKKAKLISACWEANLDCTAEFLFFVDLACSDNFKIAMEAFTVIETIENPIPTEELQEAEKQIASRIAEEPDTTPLLEDLLTTVNNFKH